jgi:hypothetical protein
MDNPGGERKHRSYRWSKEARDIVAEFIGKTDGVNKKDRRDAQAATLTRLVNATGYPRYACARFLRQSQFVAGEPRPWTKEDKQRLLDLTGVSPLPEVARVLRRSPDACRTMLYRLGGSMQMSKDWFTKYTLAKALRMTPVEIQRWIDKGLLKERIIETNKGLTKKVIDADAFEEFCKINPEHALGRRINADRIDFIRTFVFPSHSNKMLKVRESKKERTAFEEQNRKTMAIDGAVHHIPASELN